MACVNIPACPCMLPTARNPDFEIAGEASTGHEALVKFEQFQPDVILLDLEMPEMDGVKVIRQR